MWTPKEVRKLIAQFVGVLFGIRGIILMISDVKATGKINITTNLVSGQIESGSAGLLLLFFSFFLVLIPAFLGWHSVVANELIPESINSRKRLSNNQRNVIISLVSVTITIICFFSSRSLNKSGDANFSAFLTITGFCFGTFSGLAIIGTMFDFGKTGEEIKGSSE